MNRFSTILITGTTSGIGRAFLDYYHQSGATVISINRRHDKVLESQYPNHIFKAIDITDPEAIYHLLKDLQNQNVIPDLIILNAGINRPDNFDGLDLSVFHGVMQTNLYGSFNFLGAITKLQWKNKTIVTLSSTSNIVPNPAHLGYYLSKRILKDSIPLLQKSDPSNFYKTIVLGPVHTNITAGSPPFTGLKKWLFDFLAVSAQDTARASAKFFESRRQVFYYPKFSVGFYFLVSMLLNFIPQLYKGTTAPQSAR